MSEFTRQLDHLVTIGYPTAMGITERAFRTRVAPLEQLVMTGVGQPVDQRIPFVMVVPGVPVELALPMTRQGEKQGYVDMNPVEPAGFSTIPDEVVPAQPYLLVDVDTGRATASVRPKDALGIIRGQGRHPLTLAEGVALLLVFPDVLRDRNCYQMLASRESGSKRIPSLWVTKQGHPRLGWCFDGVPHTWLGAASCAGRISAPA